MCGRFTYKFTWKQINALLSLNSTPADERQSFNVTPTQQAPVVRPAEGGNELVFLRWGLVPSWAKDKKDASTRILARAETAATSPAYRAAFAKRRCIVPISGFYEWEETGDKSRQPWYIYRADEQPMLLAALWESWKDQNGTTLESFAIVTTPPNAAVARLKDRMPAVLEPEQAKVWLDPATTKEQAAALPAPAADGVLAMHPVSRRVNIPTNNSPDLLEEVAPAKQTAQPDAQLGLFGS